MTDVRMLYLPNTMHYAGNLPPVTVRHIDVTEKSTRIDQLAEVKRQEWCRRLEAEAWVIHERLLVDLKVITDGKLATTHTCIYI